MLLHLGTKQQQLLLQPCTDVGLGEVASTRSNGTLTQ
jgi:hypothetical protein